MEKPAVRSQDQTYVPGSTLRSDTSIAVPERFDLARLAWLRPFIESRWPLFIARAITLAGFIFTILAGLIGTPVGGRNFAIIFVWIAWWTALKLLFIPLGGRSWCAVCPLPMPGEWLQQGGLISRQSQRRGLGLRWPKRLRGSWMQSGLFLVIGLFSAVTLTDARLTAWILLGLIGIGMILSLVFERRSFCTYLCPIGGFTGIYAKIAPVEVRVKNISLCATHSEKTCYLECPWGIYPVALRDSSQCGLCMECLRVCPKDNIALNLRPFGTDLKSGRGTLRLDESFLALVMLGSAVAFTAVFTGPWGILKTAAYQIGAPAWFGYSSAFLAFTLLVLPAAFTLATWAGNRLQVKVGARQVGARREKSSLTGQSSLASPLRPLASPLLRQALARGAQTLLPLGLFSWIAFTISFALPKFSYVVNVLSDPLGWGWDLFGTADVILTTDLATIAPVLQLASLLTGLFWSASLAIRQASSFGNSGGKDLLTIPSELSRPAIWKPVWRSALPLVLFHLSYTLLLSWLLVG
jgi:polyferredoxin